MKAEAFPFPRFRRERRLPGKAKVVLDQGISAFPGSTVPTRAGTRKNGGFLRLSRIPGVTPLRGGAGLGNPARSVGERGELMDDLSGMTGRKSR
jgi:hypothetical protein